METQQTEEQTERDKVYSKILDITKKKVYELPKAKGFLSREIRPEYVNVATDISKEVNKLVEQHTKELTDKIKNAEAEVQRVKETNARQEGKISELETNLKEEKGKYGLLIVEKNKYESILKEIARKLPEDILSSDLYERKEEDRKRSTTVV